MLGKEDLKEQVELIKATAESIVISNEEELKNATEFVKKLKEQQKVVSDFYEPMVKATKESYDKIKYERDILVKPLKETEQEIRLLMNYYNNKVLQLKKAEEERIKKQKEEQEKQLKELQKEVENGNVEYLQEKVDTLMSQTTIPERTVEIPKITGMGTRITYKVEITDISKIPTSLNNVPLVELSKVGKEYILQQYKVMKAVGQSFEIPGITIKEEVTTIIR